MVRKSAINDRVEIWNNKDITVGASLSGYYVRDQRFKSRNYGEGIIRVIKGESGSYLGVMNTAAIERAFLNIPLGSRVWLTYKGLETSANGRSVKTYDVDYDDEDKLIERQANPVLPEETEA